MSRIFISYRREDTAGYNLSLAEQLKRHFGPDQIFMDLDSIKPGLDFRTVIHDAVTSCDALIALIGKNWLTITDDDGQRRLDNPEDFVRLEVASALDRGDILVIPALVHGARVPKSDELPDNLKELAYRNAIELRDSSFSYDVGRLIETLDDDLKKSPARAKQVPRLRPSLAAFRGRRAAFLAVPLAAILALAIYKLIPARPVHARVGPAPALSTDAAGAGTALIRDSLAAVSRGSLPVSSGDSHFQARYSGGSYWITSGSNEAGWLIKHQASVTVLKAGPLMDGSIAVDGRLTGATRNRNISVYCRWNTNGIGYGLFVYPTNRTFQIFRFDGIGQSVRLKSGFAGAIRAGARWNRIELSCIGSDITAAVNGTQVTSLTDANHVDGSFLVGAGVGASEPNVSANFANLLVTQPSDIVAQDTLRSDILGTIGVYNTAHYSASYAKGWYDIDIPDRHWLQKTGGLIVPINVNPRAGSAVVVDTKLLSAASNRYVDLKCRWNPTTNSGYGLYVEPGTTGNGQVYLDRATNGRNTELSGQQDSKAVYPGGKWNRIALSCVGNTVSAWVNGINVAIVHDGTYKSGALELGTGIYGNAPNVEALFADLIVSKR